ncbi:MAG: hypothetical protein IKB51_03530 [Clostridia bacterium]|nr:hypothetical protein [Clostridia bacterium]
MNEIGVLKEIDKVGRIVIPKELRERYAFNDEIEIIATSEGVLIKNPEYFLTKIEEIKESPLGKTQE